MVLDFPTRARPQLGEAERVRQLQLPIAVRRRLPVVYWAQRNRRVLTFAVFAFAVLGFSGAWTGGALVLDGPGISLYVRMVLDHLGADRMVPYWMPELWAGAPLWAVAPTLPVFLLAVPATAVGADVAVKLGVLAFQVFGACGAFVLARSLWRSFPAAVAAGILFALQPLVIAHGALAGAQPTVGVMATAPWIVWSLRKGLRGEGPGYLVVTGFLSGFAVLLEAEYAIGIALLCACLLVVETARAGTGRNPAGIWRLLARGAAVVAVAAGSVAYWLLPFARLGKSFALSPAGLVPGELLNGGAAQASRELGAFFGRPRDLSGVVGFSRTGLPPLFFHLGWVCLALTLVSVALVSRRDRDGTLTAVLLSSAVGLWLSAGAVPLASSGPAQRSQVVPFVIAGLAAGLLLGALLRPLGQGRLAPIFVVVAAAFLAAVPYLTPFVTLQKLLPFLDSLRFPHLYAVAPLALALGAAYPIVVAGEWAEAHRARSAPAALPAALSAAVALTVVGLFLVDVWPARSYYRVRPPATGDAYRQVAAAVAAQRGDFRVAPTQIVPTAVGPLLDTGRPLTVGWPHFVAGEQVWRLTAEPLLTPSAYRERAYGLAATAYQVIERPTDTGTSVEAIPSVDLVANPRALPMVRAYSRTVALAGRDITPEMAVALAYRNVGVFTGSPSASPALAATTVVDVRSPDPCADDSGSRLDPALASQLGVVCGLHAWIGSLGAGVDVLNIEPGVGARFRATTDRLQGISAYLDRAPDRAEVALHEVLPGGRSLGPARARGKAVGVDEYGLVAFTFDPVAGSAGKEYAFVLTCPGCPAERVPRLVAGHSPDRPGNLLVGGTLRPDRVAAFTPIYETVAADPPSTTTVEPARAGPGRWRIRATGTQPALVVVAEAWFPGWEAEVDGVPTTVVEADGGFLGVPVGAGDHLVTLEYHRPAAATAGRLVTAATLLTVAGLALRRRRPGAAAGAVGPSRASRPSRRRPPRPWPGERPIVGAPDPEETDWDDVVRPHRGPAVGDEGRGPEPPRPSRRPGTAQWPPEPL